MNNQDLHQIYQRGYGNHIKQSTFEPHEERKAILDYMPSWEGLEVLELGCGLGQLANLIALSGAKLVHAVDYCEEAIQIAKKIQMGNVIFETCDLHNAEGRYDVIVMQGVLEHLDKPYEELKTILDQNLKDDGILITSSPNWMNPRGYVWMTVYYMIRIHMAAVDLNFIYPWAFAEWAEKNEYMIEYKSCDQDWGSGQKMLYDFNKRLRMDIFNEHLRVSPDVDDFLLFLGKSSQFFTQNNFTGANLIYKLQRKKA